VVIRTLYGRQSRLMTIHLFISSQWIEQVRHDLGALTTRRAKD